MIKIVRFFFVAFLFFNLSVSSQIDNGVIEYKKTWTKKIINKKKQKESLETFKKFSIIEDRINKAQNKLTFKLIYSNNESLFKVEEEMLLGDDKFLNMSIGPDGKGVFFNSKTLSLKQLDAFGELFIISKLKDRWTITNETKKIGIYNTFKAFLTEKIKTRNGFKEIKVIAWFTPEINVPFGPIGYSGLPGLILELNKDRLKYYATKIDFAPKEKIIIKKFKRGKKVSYDEFYDIAIGTMKNHRK
ncbi:GLPGLI family protein [Tenacibaculum haliotis]|uniref:GLPGLI family protein n=1 Tax=Tenacibaculum haliotis TaxID=1888914 RepID=UPI0021AE5AEF|nr:GLPGLI family protein [Tenacibaculum haliotis]MCT4700047.1 GLPGLI family protein [Tenacibaculum haliotis]